MKLRVTIDGEECLLRLEKKPGELSYTLEGSSVHSGSGSVLEIAPGVFSVLLGPRSYTVHVLPAGDEFSVWVEGRRHAVAISDIRDRPAQQKTRNTAGPLELLAQMPGKVVKLLVEAGDAVETGQSLIVVEAMKMQNEMKSPKDGTVTAIHAAAGATVAAGERLLVVE